LKTWIYILLLNLLLHTALSAQTESETMGIDPITDSLANKLLHSEIPSLQILIDSALVNSPLIHASEAEIAQVIQQLKTQRKSWAQYIFFEASARYGLFNQISISELTVDDVTTGVKSENEQLNYYGGVGIRVPLSGLISRRSETKTIQFTLVESEYRTEQLKRELTLLIIQEYYALKTYQESMQTTQEVMQTIEISYMKSLNDMETGKISLDDFALLASTRGKAKENYMKAKNDFFMQYHMLQILTGIKF